MQSEDSIMGSHIFKIPKKDNHDWGYQINEIASRQGQTLYLGNPAAAVRLVEIIKLKEVPEWKEKLQVLKLLLATENEAVLWKFVSSGGIKVLHQWLGQSIQILDEPQKTENEQEKLIQKECLGKMLSTMHKLPMNVELLKKSKVGKQVNRVKKHEGCERSLRAKATLIVNKWKLLVEDSKREAPRRLSPVKTVTVKARKSCLKEPGNSRGVQLRVSEKMDERVFKINDPPNAPPLSKEEFETI